EMISCRSAAMTGAAETAPTSSAAATILDRLFNNMIVLLVDLVGWQARLGWSVQDGAQEIPEFGSSRLQQGLPSGSVFVDAALMHEDHPVGDIPGEVHLVGDQHHGHALARQTFQHAQ